MGSVGNTNPWAPYDNYKDCSLGICSIYCPQFCYLIFPPPPPSDDDSTAPFSPLIIAIIGVLASAFLLVSYYTIVTRYCKRTNVQTNAETEEIGHDDHQWSQIASSGLDEATIKTITVCKYKKGDGLIEGTECSVCLSEFEENESLRLLPKCSHAFHLPCIDTWLKSHSNCPLCRAGVVSLAPPVAHPSARNSVDFHVNSYEIQRPDDLVLVVDSTPNSFIQEFDQSENVGPQAQPVLTPKSIGVGKGAEEAAMGQLLPEPWSTENVGNDQGGGGKFRRSVSLGAFSGEGAILISDIMKIEGIEEDVEVGIDQSLEGIGSSMGLLRSPVAMKRSVSTGRFMFTVQDKGKNSIIPT